MPIDHDDIDALRNAVRLLEHPSLAARLTNMVGMPVALIRSNRRILRSPTSGSKSCCAFHASSGLPRRAAAASSHSRKRTRCCSMALPNQTMGICGDRFGDRRKHAVKPSNFAEFRASFAANKIRIGRALAGQGKRIRRMDGYGNSADCRRAI